MTQPPQRTAHKRPWRLGVLPVLGAVASAFILVLAQAATLQHQGSSPSQESPTTPNPQPAQVSQQTPEPQTQASLQQEPQQQLEQAQARIQALETELAALYEKQRVTYSQLTVAESALEFMAEDLAAARQEISNLRQSVAFYERLIPDGTPTGKLSIRSAELHALNNDLLQYRVLVMRHGTATAPFQGTLQFLASGKRDGSSATISLEQLANVPISEDGVLATSGSASSGLNFRQYQRASGLLAIPPGFEPVTITIRVLEGKAVRAEHTISLAKES